MFIEVQYIFCHLCDWKIKHIFSKLVYWALFKITRHDNKIAYAGSLRNTLSYAMEYLMRHILWNLDCLH